MPLHLLKMCVGIADIDQLHRVQQARPDNVHRTRNMPKRAAELLDGGSIYWVIKGEVRVRQGILALQAEVDGDARRLCAIGLDRVLVPTIPVPHRPIQGWRYLPGVEAPPDLASADSEESAAMPAGMLRELRALGLI